MMFPPKSGRKAVRLRNAAVISGISYLYSHITSLWLSAGEPFEAARQQKGASANRVWSPQLREKVISIAEQLQDLRVRTVMSKWEGSIRGAWAFEDYNQLVELENDMLGSLILVRRSCLRPIVVLTADLLPLRRWLVRWSTWTRT